MNKESSSKISSNKIRESFAGILNNNAVDENITDKIVIINIRRLFYASMITIPISLVEIIFFLLNPASGSEKEYFWRMGIIIAQTAIIIIMTVFAIISYNFRKEKKPNLFMKIIQYISVIAILFLGAAIVSIDQLVTPNITPYIIVCTIIGAIFLLRPVYAALIYIASYALFYYALGLTQLNHTFLLSNRVNGLFALGIGICLSYILWRINVINIKQAAFIKRQQQELEEKNKQLEQLAFFDPLTGLFNRRYFEEQLKNEISRVRRYGNESTVAIMDIDFFKTINDNFGHPTGDWLLKRIAAILHKHLRETDIVSRWGGEEFIILFPNTSLETGKMVTEKIRNVIENEVFLIENRKIKITVSFGVALLKGDLKDTFEQSYINADKALYNAKQNGRNRVETA